MKTQIYRCLESLYIDNSYHCYPITINHLKFTIHIIKYMGKFKYGQIQFLNLQVNYLHYKL